MNATKSCMLKTEQSNSDTGYINEFGKSSRMGMNDNGWLRFFRMRDLFSGAMMANTSETTNETQSGRTQHAWLRQLFKTLLIILLGTSMTGCADTKSWREEVKLLDGRVIVVSIKYRFEGAYNGSNYGGVLRESWVTLKLPETGNQETTWNEKLQPKNLNVVNGKLYIVATPMTTREYFLYNQPRPPYIGYIFDNKAWRRIPFNEIPVVMYDMNLSSGSVHSNPSGPVTLADKAKAFEDPRVDKTYLRIDPTFENPGFPKNTVKVY